MNKDIEQVGFEEKYFDTGEVKLHYLVGPNNGLPLVLIPAQGLSLESYQRVLVPLSKDFQVFAVDVRGHGKSSWTTGNYNFPNMGKDFKKLLENIIQRPAIISGNSSGGLIALWLAANVPDKVRGVILEDTPVFSAEWPRLRDDCFIYRIFKLSTETIGSSQGRNLVAFIKGMEVPIEGKQKVIQFPVWLTGIISIMVRFHEWLKPGKPVDLPLLPAEARMMIKSFSEYDPDFTRAFVNGRACKEFSHAEALVKVKCPLLVLQANWFRHPKFGLVGAMDDKDLEQLHLLAPHAQYKRITSGHMIHFENPKQYIKEVKEFAVQDIVR
ncbi:MAG: hydrolase [Candidatus Colwellbacteria bacterium RIFCSPLOWO2_12_FULL_44_13]|uniref:Hydrolase n=3 Tax=Candidatus Colwelliibacteriota TaxID=1817904 RepID=A0A1G1Z5P3_9BACT|nr:MAG: hydrolase [Candidatus Colwellbacteria bacterium RIFCSPHIGHO2_12_FULL_44_17]OGY61780.1 MAG: hydrolase [Candidatus Colwellbacteria bacterium RIFCSPLOWO2_12_FULL_44_13]